MTLPEVLTDIRQLEGKTITLIDTFDSFDVQTLYYTDDHCLLVEMKSISNSYGDEFIQTDYMQNMLEIYEEYERELSDEWLIITAEQEKELKRQLEDKREAEAIETNKKIKAIEYDQYLRLKRKFEVEWKL